LSAFAYGGGAIDDIGLSEFFQAFQSDQFGVSRTERYEADGVRHVR
jgi:hypothetical protein